jgi:hypothetical protein
VTRVERTGDGRLRRQPDVFLSHSSRDKTFVRKLAEDLTFCEVDVWLDEWELQAGDSLQDLIGNALEKSRFIGVVLGDNFSDSRWARDELKQALSRERRSDRVTVLPLLCGNCPVPAFLEDKVFIDFQRDYYGGVIRLAGTIHGISSLRIEVAIRFKSPGSLRDVLDSLRYCGVEPYVVLGEDDFREIAAAQGVIAIGDKVRFSPERVRDSDVSPRIRHIMTKLIDEVW